MNEQKLYFKYENTPFKDSDEVVYSYGVVNSLSDGIVTATVFVSYGKTFEFHNNFMFEEGVLDTLEEIEESEFKASLLYFATNINGVIDEVK